MSKDAYWFKHDSNASRDLRLMQIRAIHGYEGIGVFWGVIEVLREQHFYRWSEKDVNILAKILDYDQIKFKNIMFDFNRVGLLVFDSGFIYSSRLKRDMKIWESKKGNRTKDERNANELVTNQEDKRRGDKSTEEDIRVFNEFRVKYPGSKTGNNTEFDNFVKKHKDWRLVLPVLSEVIDRQIASRAQRSKSGAFVPEWKMLKTWINQRCWEEVSPLPPVEAPRQVAIPAEAIFGDTNNK